MNEYIKLGLTFTIAFLVLWLVTLTRGYAYFIAWKNVMIALIIFLWSISLIFYFIFEVIMEKVKT